MGRWAAERLSRALRQPPDSGDVPPAPINSKASGKSSGLGHPWWVLSAGGIFARRIAGWRVRIDLVGALELSVHLAAGGSRFGVTCLRLVL
jgi:hypothetical protein